MTAHMEESDADQEFELDDCLDFLEEEARASGSQEQSCAH